MPTWQDVRDIENLRGQHNLRGIRSHAIQSQYSASKNLLALAKGFQLRLDPSDEINLFFDKIFNVLTAEGEGLDNWGRILAIGRTIADNKLSITLDDEPFRLLLLYKALANISPSDPDSLNILLDTLTATGIGELPPKGYVIETAPMVIRWVFEDFLNEIQLAVFKAAGTLARGGGVGWELYAVNPSQVFGFDGGDWQMFGQAPFASDNALVIG